MLTSDEYELLRRLASPVVAVTASHGGRNNGMILDSAARATISPQFPRLSIYVHKWHLSHELIWQSGRFTAHLLHREQFDLIYDLGFVSGRAREKLKDIPFRLGLGGVPVLLDCYAAFECRLVNTMDGGASTCFLGQVEATTRGGGKEIMTADYFRANMPAGWREEFAQNYREAQERIAKNAGIAEPRLAP